MQKGMRVGDHPLLGCREGVSFAGCLFADAYTEIPPKQRPENRYGSTALFAL